MRGRVNTTSTKSALSMSNAQPKQKPSRQYQKHGDTTRARLEREHRLKAINGSTAAGRDAKAWRAYALSKKGGKQCPVDLKQKIEAGTFALWRALELRAFIVADQRRRGSLLNLRYRTLPSVNEHYDTALSQWQKINDELQLNTELDLARRFQLQSGGKP
jgi:hypothetical protein